VGQAEDAIAFARAQIGKPYRFGAKGPDAYDCSGLIVAAYEHANPPIRLPHWTGALIAVGTEVTRSELEPGDLVFPDAGHVQLYTGNNQMIEAQRQGVPVREGPLWGFWRARRVVGESGTSPAGAVAEGVGSELSELFGPWLIKAPGVEVNIPNPLAPFKAGVTVVEAVASPDFWKRIGAGAIGAFMVFLGLLWIMRRPITAATSTVGQAVGSVGSTILSGAAFGVGASAAPAIGGKAAQASAVPARRRIPRAPDPAKVKAIEPTTAPISPRSPYQVSPGSVFVGKARRPAAPLVRSAKDTEIPKTGIWRNK